MILTGTFFDDRIDIAVSGILAFIISTVQSTSFLSRQERVIFEVIASFLVGGIAGAVALIWVDKTCFSAMAIGGILDLLQGFRVVFSVIEVLSTHTVSGAADLMEAILITTLVSYFLRVGQYLSATVIAGPNATPEFGGCENAIDRSWFFLLVPIGAVSWSIVFTPGYNHLIPMTIHGCMAYILSFSLLQFAVSKEFAYFVSAAAVSMGSGVVSRFTGRQAVGNTMAGVYCLVPGAYLVSTLYNGSWETTWFSEIILQAIVIGIGSWTGTMLCSPILLGSVRALMSSQQKVIPGVLRKHLNKRRFADDDDEEEEDPVKEQRREQMRILFQF
jgi:uncharacterized membrane protein YjjP (DUF1212 family)